jgi:predicted O-linked N-acetylglucosamine transferase (SPINDLY family)
MSQLPTIYATAAEIPQRRQQYRQHLQELVRSTQPANPDQLAQAAMAVGAVQPFFLAYQGQNDRDLQHVYGRLICYFMASCYPQWSQSLQIPTLSASEKVRVGIVSRFFYNHSNWKIPIKGWVENLDRSEFELFGYYTETHQDHETHRAVKAFDKFIQGPLPLEQWCEQIQRDNLHILIFPEFGMDPMTVQLGCLRLAPIQITSWGHPDTSGLPTIDYYLSSDLMEPENAQEHYTETLVRLPNLGIHYTPLPVQPEIRAKADLGLAADDVLFWCCQSLFKYLPQHDDVFPRIAQALPGAKFAFIQHSNDRVTELFRQRLSRAFQALELNAQEHCLFLPRMNQQTFAATAAGADVFLDSIGWSGCNSTLESISHNTPVVTWPGELMRSRHSMAILKMMGLEATIARSKQEYIQIAVRLGQEPEYRQQISQAIAQNRHQLYRDPAPVKALEEFLLQVLKKPRRFCETRVADWLQQALQHQCDNQLGEAEHLYRQILEVYPEHPEALLGLGLVMQQQGQLEAAEHVLSHAAQAQPDSAKIWFSLGNVRQTQGQLSQAVEAYQRAIALRPDAAPIYYNLGYVWQQQGQLDAAVAAYQKALALQPNCIEAEVNLGLTLQAQGQLSPDQQRHYSSLSQKLAARSQAAGDWQTAVTYYQNAQDLEPENGEIDLQLGKLYQDQRQFQAAVVAYRRGLIRINPHYAAAIAVESDADPAPFVVVSPPLAPREVMVADHAFPAIPALSDRDQPRPFWSVIITVYNRTAYLLECLASVLAQWPGADAMEIVVMDDASPSPEIAELVRGLGQGIVRYYRNPENCGLPGNWNVGVSLSRGQWIHLLHDDDFILPGFYTRLQSRLESSPERVGAAFTGYANLDEAGKVVFSQQVYGDQAGIAADFIQRIGVANPLNMSAVVIRREIHETLGGYHPELTYTSDWELYKRIAAAYAWWYEPEILACYRQHSQSKTQEMLLSGTQVLSIRRAIEMSESYLPPESCAEITAKARQYYFKRCLEKIAIPLGQNDLAVTWRMLQETLKIDRSPAALAQLFSWLTCQEAASLRDEMVSRLIALTLN